MNPRWLQFHGPELSCPTGGCKVERSALNYGTMTYLFVVAVGVAVVVVVVVIACCCHFNRCMLL